MLFIMFDIEIIFAYPYAVSQRELGTFVFWEIIAFSAVFFVAFVYVVARGALDWGPVKKDAPLVDIGVVAEPGRNVRVVGLEGRERSSELVASR